jgi:hypothetical protein
MQETKTLFARWVCTLSCMKRNIAMCSIERLYATVIERFWGTWAFIVPHKEQGSISVGVVTAHQTVTFGWHWAFSTQWSGWIYRCSIMKVAFIYEHTKKRHASALHRMLLNNCDLSSFHPRNDSVNSILLWQSSGNLCLPEQVFLGLKHNYFLRMFLAV